jgi:hypothetical protein
MQGSWLLQSSSLIEFFSNYKPSAGRGEPDTWVTRLTGRILNVLTMSVGWLQYDWLRHFLQSWSWMAEGKVSP